MKIYTKGGDKGKTHLVGGDRIDKDNPRVDLYGKVDTLNSWIGLTNIILSREESKNIQRIQNNLFTLGGELASPKSKEDKLDHDLVSVMETHIDEMSAKLPSLKNFILPGGHEVSARLHMCRVTTRNLERSCVQFSKLEELPLGCIIFLNRLSDYFFVLARYANWYRQEKDVIWEGN